MQRTDKDGHARWVHFADAQACVEAWYLEEILPALRSLEAASQKGLHAVGWMAYEAAPAFDPHLKVHPLPAGTPYLRFTIYRTMHAGLPKRDCGETSLQDLKPLCSERQFTKAVKDIHQAIAAGETYQVNFTYPLEGIFSGDTWQWFRQLRQAQAAQHQAYIEEADQVIISASPERFFRHEGKKILCKPMKGTAQPGETEMLRTSVKNRAENVMIVDMIRNDLGKLANPGSVCADPLFEVTAFPSLVQMTSTVSATGSRSPVDWLCALFPCASITGAPKRQTMAWIHQLESGPRGIYTGCMGGFYGDGVTEFNVAIRTAVIERNSGKCRYHSGCGIVWDSDPQEEYRESVLKTKVLTHRTAPFSLIETMRGDPDSGIALWPFHQKRLLTSAATLGVEVDEVELTQKITALDFPKLGKVRLTLSEAGKIEIVQSPFPEVKASMTFRVDTVPTPSTHPQLKHKTTRRDIYQAARDRHPEVDETLLINERGELMEFCIGSLVWVKQGNAYTPPLSSGCLPGVAREAELARGGIQEKICQVSDLKEADEIYLINALRGRVQMQIVEGT